MADRRNKTVRNMVLSMGAIVVVVLVILGLMGGWSFSPGRPSGGTAPTADVQKGFSSASSSVGFPVAVPRDVPAQWHGSSFSLTPAVGATSAAPPTARGGWLIPSGAYITLIQSSGAPDAVRVTELGSAGPSSATVKAGGAAWSITSGVRTETAWFRTAGNTTLLITGSASPADFATLAATIAP